MDAFCRALEMANLSRVAFGSFELSFASAGDLSAFQQGYATHALTGAPIASSAPGGWHPEWCAFGRNSLADPLFVDLDDPEWMVLTAEHGTGAWSPQMVAPSFTAFVALVAALRELAGGRENPVALEANPPSAAELAAFYARVDAEAGSFTFWSVDDFLP